MLDRVDCQIVTDTPVCIVTDTPVCIVTDTPAYQTALTLKTASFTFKENGAPRKDKSSPGCWKQPLDVHPITRLQKSAIFTKKFA
jgi:hypothetical protein